MTKVIMHKNLCTSFLTMAENATRLHVLLVGHSFLTKKQKIALRALRQSLIEIVQLNAAGTRPKEIEQDGEIAVEDFIRYRNALQWIRDSPAVHPEAAIDVAFKALHPPIPEEEMANRRSGKSHNTGMRKLALENKGKTVAELKRFSLSDEEYGKHVEEDCS